jgi:hypothetical protein
MRLPLFVFLWCSGCVSEVYVPAKPVQNGYTAGYTRGYAAGVSDSNSDKVYIHQESTVLPWVLSPYEY